MENPLLRKELCVILGESEEGKILLNNARLKSSYAEALKVESHASSPNSEGNVTGEHSTLLTVDSSSKREKPTTGKTRFQYEKVRSQFKTTFLENIVIG